MQVRTLPLGPFETNAYLVWNAARQALILDPGSEAATLIAAVEAEAITPLAVLLTHAHFDHIGALAAVVDRFRVPVVLHPRDVVIYESPANAMEPFFPRPNHLPPTQPHLPDNLGDLACEILPTPGHTPGGVGYYFRDAGILFAGDTLFRRGVGRADLPGGDWETLLTSIGDVLYALPPETKVYPGHGGPTTIGEEAAGNPYVRGGA